MIELEKRPSPISARLDSYHGTEQTLGWSQARRDGGPWHLTRWVSPRSASPWNYDATADLEIGRRAFDIQLDENGLHAVTQIHRAAHQARRELCKQGWFGPCPKGPLAEFDTPCHD